MSSLEGRQSLFSLFFPSDLLGDRSEFLSRELFINSIFIGFFKNLCACMGASAYVCTCVVHACVCQKSHINVFIVIDGLLMVYFQSGVSQCHAAPSSLDHK